MSNLSDRVPIPPKDTMNTGLSPAKESTMLKKLGKPGQLTKDCSDPFQKFKKRLKFNVDVGPFKVSGLDFAVESLRQIFAEVQQQLPQVFAEVKTAGMLCVRHRRKSAVLFSNHSFGTAIDIFFWRWGRRPGCTSSAPGQFPALPVLQSPRLVLGSRILRRF